MKQIYYVLILLTLFLYTCSGQQNVMTKLLLQNGFESNIENIIFSPDGKYLVAYNKQEVKIYDIKYDLIVNSITYHKLKVAEKVIDVGVDFKNNTIDIYCENIIKKRQIGKGDYEIKKGFFLLKYNFFNDKNEPQEVVQVNSEKIEFSSNISKPNYKFSNQYSKDIIAKIDNGILTITKNKEDLIYQTEVSRYSKIILFDYEKSILLIENKEFEINKKLNSSYFEYSINYDYSLTNIDFKKDTKKNIFNDYIINGSFFYLKEYELTKEQIINKFEKEATIPKYNFTYNKKNNFLAFFNSNLEISQKQLYLIKDYFSRAKPLLKNIDLYSDVYFNKYQKSITLVPFDNYVNNVSLFDFSTKKIRTKKEQFIIESISDYKNENLFISTGYNFIKYNFEKEQFEDYLYDSPDKYVYNTALSNYKIKNFSYYKNEYFINVGNNFKYQKYNKSPRLLFFNLETTIDEPFTSASIYTKSTSTKDGYSNISINSKNKKMIIGVNNINSSGVRNLKSKTVSIYDIDGLKNQFYKTKDSLQLKYKDEELWDWMNNVNSESLRRRKIATISNLNEDDYIRILNDSLLIVEKLNKEYSISAILNYKKLPSVVGIDNSWSTLSKNKKTELTKEHFESDSYYRKWDNLKANEQSLLLKQDLSKIKYLNWTWVPNSSFVNYFNDPSNQKYLWMKDKAEYFKNYVNFPGSIKNINLVNDYLIGFNEMSMGLVATANNSVEFSKIIPYRFNINNINYSNNSLSKPFYFVLNENGFINVYNAVSNKLVVTLAIMDKEYFVFTPDNYYLSSKLMLNTIGFQRKNMFFKFDQFDLKYNRPDIVLERIGCSSNDLINLYKNAYQKRLKKLGFTEDNFNEDFHLPEIKLTNKGQINFSTDKKEIELLVKANDTKYKLDRINVWVNDVPIFGIKGIDLKNENTSNISKSIKAILNEGRNKIQFSTLNQKGAESYKETIYMNYNPEEKSKPNLYIVSIGVSQYENSDYNLQYASKDAIDISEALEFKNMTFNEIYTTTLLNEEVSIKNVKQIKQKLLKTNVDDEVIIFYAGHGILDENLDYYLGSYNINFENPSKNGLAYDELEKLLDGIPARKKLLMIDACHSGEIDKDDAEEIETTILAQNNKSIKNITFRSINPKNASAKIGLQNSFELMKELFTDLRRGTGATIISSAGGGEFALEGNKWNNGVFTYSVLEALTTTKADYNKDGIIQVSELRNYVQDNVERLTDGQQKPTNRRENLEFDFAIW